MLAIYIVINSILNTYAEQNHHSIKWEEVSVVDRARTTKELLVKEAIHIRLNHRCHLRHVQAGINPLLMDFKLRALLRVAKLIWTLRARI